jgi:hypothetical protein
VLLSCCSWFTRRRGVLARPFRLAQPSSSQGHPRCINTTLRRAPVSAAYRRGVPSFPVKSWGLAMAGWVPGRSRPSQRTTLLIPSTATCRLACVQRPGFSHRPGVPTRSPPSCLACLSVVCLKGEEECTGMDGPPWDFSQWRAAGETFPPSVVSSYNRRHGYACARTCLSGLAGVVVRGEHARERVAVQGA